VMCKPREYTDKELIPSIRIGKLPGDEPGDTTLYPSGQLPAVRLLTDPPELDPSPADELPRSVVRPAVPNNSVNPDYSRAICDAPE
jgi:hypothetical protein